jgi:hypothetical protein
VCVSLCQATLPKLREVLFTGNPIYEGLGRDEQRMEVLKRLPEIHKIDGDMVTPLEREQVRQAGSPRTRNPILYHSRGVCFLGISNDIVAARDISIIRRTQPILYSLIGVTFG